MLSHLINHMHITQYDYMNGTKTDFTYELWNTHTLTQAQGGGGAWSSVRPGTHLVSTRQAKRERADER